MSASGPVVVHPPPPRVPGAVWGSALGLSALSLTFVARLPGFPAPVALFFVFVAISRLVIGRAGRGLVPPRALRSLQISGVAIGTAWLFHHLGTGPALIGLLLLCVAVQAYLLIPRQTAFIVFLQILFSSTTAVGTAFLAKDTPALVLAVAYVLALAWTLLLYERGAALTEPESRQGAVHKLRTTNGNALPARPLVGTVLRFVLLGFPLGLLLYVAVPRTFTWIDPNHVEIDKSRRDREGGGGGSGTRISAITGPALKAQSGGATVAFGTVADVQQDFTPFWEIREIGRPLPPLNVILREDARDLITPEGNWSASDDSERFYACDASGSVEMGWADDPRRGRTLSMVALVGGGTRLYLEPNGVDFRVRRNGRVRRRYLARRNAAEVWSLPFPLLKSDIVRQRSVPVRYADAQLVGRRSDSDVSPRLTYLQLPDGLKRPLRRIAFQVVGEERDAWRRAQLLDAWLRSDEFVYALKPPPVDPDNRILDFLQRTKTGYCEHFATSLTVLLRALGHPTRWVHGFWGGDPSESRGSVIMRGTHYHAWCEMYLDGVGWVPLNPTPPDRRPIDADTRTVEAQAGREEGESFSFLGLNSENWSPILGRDRELDPALDPRPARPLVQPGPTALLGAAVRTARMGILASHARGPHPCGEGGEEAHGGAGAVRRGPAAAGPGGHPTAPQSDAARVRSDRRRPPPADRESVWASDHAAGAGALRGRAGSSPGPRRGAGGGVPEDGAAPVLDA